MFILKSIQKPGNYEKHRKIRGLEAKSKDDKNEQTEL